MSAASRFSSISLVLAFAVAAAAPPAAVAQPASATAEQLFRNGKHLMGEGRYEEACVAFDGSYRKDPAISTLLNLADCREKNRQYASAWGHFLDADRKTRNDPAQSAMNNTARERAAKLEMRISYLVINVPDGSKLDGLVITRNGVEVDPAEWNRKTPVDGGAHAIEVKAPGHAPWTSSVDVADELDRKSIDVPRLEPAPDAVEPDPLVADAPSTWTGRRKAALGLGALGLGAGVGALVLELSARDLNDQSIAESDDEEQADLHDQANSRRLYAQIAGGVAVAAVGTAVVLWVTGRPETAERAASFRPLIGRDRAGLAFTGRF